MALALANTGVPARAMPLPHPLAPSPDQPPSGASCVPLLTAHILGPLQAPGGRAQPLQLGCVWLQPGGLTSSAVVGVGVPFVFWGGTSSEAGVEQRWKR